MFKTLFFAVVACSVIVLIQAHPADNAVLEDLTHADAVNANVALADATDELELAESANPHHHFGGHGHGGYGRGFGGYGGYGRGFGGYGGHGGYGRGFGGYGGGFRRGFGGWGGGWGGGFYG